MYRLRALVWRAFKSRLKTPIIFAVDLLGPILVIGLFVILKLVLNSVAASELTNIGGAKYSYDASQNYQSTILDSKADLGKHLCREMLYFDATGSNFLYNSIQDECAIKLSQVASRAEVIGKLRESLDLRILHKAPNRSLARVNASDSCIKLPGDAKIYQAGIVVESATSIQIFMTDSADHKYVYQPFFQNAPYNEYKLPQSDANSGFHLLTGCILNAFERLETGPSVTSWSMKPFKVGTNPYNLPMLFTVIFLLSSLCNSLPLIVRLADENESGFHRYLLTCGVPARVYWTGHLIPILIQVLAQSLVLSILLEIPVSTYLLDPIQSMSLVMRWLLIVSYELSLMTHCLFISLMLRKASHALIVWNFLAIGYAVGSMGFFVQWTPYGVSKLAGQLVLFNPITTFANFLAHINALAIVYNTNFNWSTFDFAIPGAINKGETATFFWILMLAHTIGWLVLTILIDTFTISSKLTPVAYYCALAGETSLSSCCMGRVKRDSDEDFAQDNPKSKSKKDPNRVCCKISNVSAVGPSKLMANTKGDSLRLTGDQLQALQHDPGTKSKTQKFVVTNALYRAALMSSAPSKDQEDAFVVDDTVEQHIVWRRTPIFLDNLNINFRFNQISFIVGQTSLKELLFDLLLGLRAMKSGTVELDGVQYGPSTITLARSHIGLLSERDILLPDMTVFENLQFFGSMRDLNYNQFDSESQFLLNLLHLANMKASSPSNLTDRSMRKLALAVAAVGHTKLLLLVEPTMNLRWKPRCQVLNLLTKYKAIRSIVVDTSDIDEAIAFGDRIVLMKDCRVDQDTTPMKLSQKFNCGYWILFTPLAGSFAVGSHSYFIEKLAHELFKNDKIGIVDVVERSLYEDASRSKSRERPKSLSQDVSHNKAFRLKIRHTVQSTKALCSILKQFDGRGHNGLTIAELTYESVEDIVVSRMSKAVYPNLPPDLLISLSHRTKVHKSRTGSPVSVREYRPSETDHPGFKKPVFNASIKSILLNRLANKMEMILTLIGFVCALIIFGIALMILQISLAPYAGQANNGQVAYYTRSATKGGGGGVAYMNLDPDQSSETWDENNIEPLYERKIGLFILDPSGQTNIDAYLQLTRNWRGNRQYTKVLNRDQMTHIDDLTMNSVIESRELIAAIVVSDPASSRATVFFEPNWPHAMIAAMNIYAKSKLKDRQKPKISRHSFVQPWHEAVAGYSWRRMYYGIGFAIAEGITLGLLVIAPIRHRSESSVTKLRTTYWIGMALFDLAMSAVLALGYSTLIVLIDKTFTVLNFFTLILVLVLYKLACFPLPYLVSLIVESKFIGFMMILLTSTTVGWVFGIHARVFVEWTTNMDDTYQYTTVLWALNILPISPMINALVDLNHVVRINHLCPQVPAYMPTTNIVNLEGPQRTTVIDKLLSKVTECLESGKSGISSGIFTDSTFGCKWDVLLILSFGGIAWVFLVLSERVFGIFARKFTSAKTSTDPMKTMIRNYETTTSVFKWDKERDRLISEYIRCINEVSYVKRMAKNSLYLRFWFKPMSDPSNYNKRLAMILDPLVPLGFNRNEISIELRTTLQLFVRVGCESSKNPIDRVRMIEIYSKILDEHSDTLVKFAVVNWSREMLYKILLHGHYNMKPQSL